PEPGAPVRWLLHPALEPARHRMSFAQISEPRPKGAFGDAAARLGGKDDVERRAPDAGLARIVWTGRDQHRASLPHKAGDVVEIDDRQHALPRIAIEDDQLKVVDLLL